MSEKQTENTAEETIRLNKAIAQRSKYSRREADRLILEGAVKIGRQPVTDPATKVAPDERIFIHGKPLPKASDKYTVIVYNKQKGELVTKSDPRGRKTIYDTLGAKYRHFLPVGRLDYASEGLLLLTDSAEVATALMTGGLERVYNLKFKGGLTPAVEEAMREGLELEDASKGAHDLAEAGPMRFAPFVAWKVLNESGGYTRLRVVIAEGKNRELRRFFAHFDRPVMDLKRVAFGEVTLSNLGPGKSRFLSKKEYADLRAYLKTQQTPKEAT